MPHWRAARKLVEVLTRKRVKTNAFSVILGSMGTPYEEIFGAYKAAQAERVSLASQLNDVFRPERLEFAIRRCLDRDGSERIRIDVDAAETSDDGQSFTIVAATRRGGDTIARLKCRISAGSDGDLAVRAGEDLLGIIRADMDAPALEAAVREMESLITVRLSADAAERGSTGR